MDALLASPPNGAPAAGRGAPSRDADELRTLVDRLAETRRRIAALQAEEVRLLHDAREYALTRMDPAGVQTDRPRDIPLRSVAAEIGAATVQSDRTVQTRMEDAATLVASFPRTLDALSGGRLSRAHAGVIAEAGALLPDDEARAAYEESVIPVAERETAGRLRPVARRLAHHAHPATLDERHERARAQRRVWVTDLDDGMAELGICAAAHLIHGAYDRLTQLATDIIDARRAAETGATPGAGPDGAFVDALTADGAAADTRRRGEVRADVATDLLLTAHATLGAAADSLDAQDALRARVQVTIPFLSLIGRSDEPADLAGYGPIDATTARRLAAGARGWDRLLTHPVTGAVLGVDRYRPTAEQRRLLRARDEHCRFPGCRQPTGRCDIDHTIAHAHDGPTDVRNLAHLCRRHHVMKHHSAWRVRQRPDGVLEWTSPTGRVYDDRPARTLAFEPAPF